MEQLHVSHYRPEALSAPFSFCWKRYRFRQRRWTHVFASAHMHGAITCRASKTTLGYERTRTFTAITWLSPVQLFLSSGSWHIRQIFSGVGAFGAGVGV